jgi:hypothetical protein
VARRARSRAALQLAGGIITRKKAFVGFRANRAAHRTASTLYRALPGMADSARRGYAVTSSFSTASAKVSTSRKVE